MIKKCIGCGVILQNIDLEKVGYTPKLDNDYCMRCFKIAHYNEDIKPKIKIDNNKIIENINNKKTFTLFLMDFLNITEEVIETYNNIKNDKCLVITKKDLFPKNIIADKFKNNVRKAYNINESIYFVSIKEDLSMFLNEIKSHNKVIVCGYTISGKSTLINKLMDSNILSSNKETTTLDFIEIKNNGFTIYDTPGFIYKYFNPTLEMKKRIKQSIKKVKESEELVINNLIINSNIDNNMIFYIPNYINIIKRKKRSKLTNRINVPFNSDLVIKDLGFINIKNNCIINTNIDLNLIEVRDSVVGAHNE